MVHHYLDNGDAKSTSNLHKHVRLCYGVEMVAEADETKNYEAASEIIKLHKDGSITEAFEWKGKGRVTYSHRQHTTTKSQCVQVFCSPRNILIK